MSPDSALHLGALLPKLSNPLGVDAGYSIGKQCRFFVSGDGVGTADAIDL